MKKNLRLLMKKKKRLDIEAKELRDQEALTASETSQLSSVGASASVHGTSSAEKKHKDQGEEVDDPYAQGPRRSQRQRQQQAKYARGETTEGDEDFPVAGSGAQNWPPKEDTYFYRGCSGPKRTGTQSTRKSTRTGGQQAKRGQGDQSKKFHGRGRGRGRGNRGGQGNN